MGCCASAASQIQAPINKPRINQVFQEEDNSMLEEQNKQKHQQIVETDETPIQQFQQDEIIMKKDPNTNNDQDNPPKKRPIRDFIQKKKQELANQPPQNNKHEQLILDIESSILNQTLTMQRLQQYADQESLSIMEILCLKTQQGYTLLELVLIYIDNYEIIQHVLLNFELPKTNLLLQLAQRIVNKMKPFRNDYSKIQQTIEFIRAVGKSNQTIEMLNQLHFSNFDTFIDFNDYNHLQLFKEISKLFFNSGVDKSFLEAYKIARNNYKFKESIVPKCIPLGQSDTLMVEKAILIHLQFNIFHQIALNKKWDQFLQYSNSYYYAPNISQTTPFMMLFKSAPINVINKYLEQYPDSLKQGIQFKSSTGMNLIHCLCMNPFIHSEEQEIAKLLNQFNQHQEQLYEVLEQPYHGQIPLIFYLDSQKDPNQLIIEFLSQNIQKQFEIEKFNKLALDSRFNLIGVKKIKSKLRVPIKQQKRFNQLNQSNQEFKSSDQFYLQYIQLAKQIIKHKFQIKFDWVKDFNVYCTFVPYDIGNVIKSFIALLIENNFIEQAKEAIEQLIKTIPEQKALLAYRLLDLKRISQEPLKSFLSEEFKKVLNESPQLLVAQSIYDIKKILFFELLDQNDKELNDYCFNLEVKFETNDKKAIMILKQLYKLKKLFTLKNKFIDNAMNCLDYDVTLERIEYDLILTIDKKGMAQGFQYKIQQVLLLLQDNQFKRPFEDLFDELIDEKPYKIYVTDKMNITFLKYMFDSSDAVQQLEKLANGSVDQFLYNILKFRTAFSFKNNQLNQKVTVYWYYYEKLMELKVSLQDLTLQECKLLYEYQLWYAYQYDTYPQIKFLQLKNIPLEPKHYRAKVVIHQILNHQSLLESMLLFPECNEEIKLNAKAFGHLTQLQIFKILKQVVDNGAIENLRVLLIIEDPKLKNDAHQILMQLAKLHFSSNPKAKCTEEQKEAFNVQARLLLDTYPTELTYYINNKQSKDTYFKVYLNNLDEKTFEQISEKSLSIENLELFVRYGLMKETKLQIQVIDKIFDFQSRALTGCVRDEFMIFDRKNKLSLPAVEHIIKMLIKRPDHEDYWGKIHVLLKRICSSNPNLVLDYYLTKMGPKRESYRYRRDKAVEEPFGDAFVLPAFIYETFLKMKDQKTLSRILGTFKLPKIQTQIFGKDEVEDSFHNYIRATTHPYCLALNLAQYKLVIESVPLKEDILIMQLITCIKSGMFEKVQYIVSKLGAFNQLTQKEKFITLYAESLQQFDQNDQQFRILNLYLEPSQDYQDIQKYQPLQSQGVKYTLCRKQVKQKYTYEFLNKQATENLDKSQKASQNVIVRKEQQEAEFCKLLHQQNSSLAKQIQNQACLFQPQIDYQEYNYDKCFDIVKKWATHKALCTLSPQYEVMDALRYPGNKVIQQKDKLLSTLAKAIEQQFLSYKTVKTKLKDYMTLIKVNCAAQFKKFFSQDFAFYTLDFNTQIVFAQELIIEDQKYEPSSSELDYLIFYLKIQNQKLIPLLKKKFQGFKLFNFSQRRVKFGPQTLFYVKNGIDLLPAKQYDLSEMRNEKEILQIERRMKFCCSYMSGIGIDIRKMTPDQIYLLYGNHDHINNKKPPQFSYGNLVLAFMSGKIDTLLYMINLNQNPAKLVCEQNIFQLLIFEQFNDQTIINIFNKFIKDNQKFANRVLYLGNVPLLYYIMLTKKERIFNECYMAQLMVVNGEQKALQILKDELAMEVGEDTDILSVALMRKNYFILNYCSGVIKPHHLDKITHYEIGNLENKKVQHKDTIYGQFVLLYQKYFYLCCQEIKFKGFDYREGKKKQLYLKEMQLSQLITYERACINKIFDLGVQLKFRNKILAIQLAKDKWDMMKNVKFAPELVETILNDYRNKDGNLVINDEIYSKIVKQSFFYQALHHKIHLELAYLNASQFLKICSIQSLNIPLVIALFQQLHKQQKIQQFENKFKKIKQKDNVQKAKQDEQQECEQGEDANSQQEEKQEQEEQEQEQEEQEQEQEEQEQEQEEQEQSQDDSQQENDDNIIFLTNNQYAFYFMKSVYDDDFHKKLSTQMKQIVIHQIQRFLLQQNLRYQMKVKPYITVEAEYFLRTLLAHNVEFREHKEFEELVENQESKERALVQAILYIDQINKNAEAFTRRLKAENLLNGNFDLDFLITIGDGPIKYLEDEARFLLPIQFVEGQFILTEEKIAESIPYLKMTNFDKNLEVEKEDFMELQNKFKDFDIASITTIDFKEIIISQQGTSILKKCFFFQHLIEQQFERTGVYQIDDVFAPHQHEQIRQPDLASQPSQIQPSLMHQQSSMGISAPRQQQQSSIINQQQIMKEDFQFMFELLPDNTYQVRQQKQKKNQKELIFAEFYHFAQPQVIVNLQKLSEEEFNKTYNNSTILTFIISDFYRYNEFLSNIIDNKEAFKWNLQFPFYIKDQHFVYEEQLFSTYNIQMIFSKMAQFIEKVKFLLGRSEDESRLVWRINTISFLEVLVCKIAEMNQKQNQKTNVSSIMQQIFSWDTLIMILHQLLYNNLIKAQQVLKVIRGVYIEFNESSDIVFIQKETKKGLDRIFQFGNTTYLLYNHILIIRLNVGVNTLEQYQKLQQQQQVKENKYQSVFKPDPQVQEYFHNIINEYDFFNQIFNPEQLIQYLFNKLEIDRQLLNYSNQLSKTLNKTITLSVDHQSLAQIFSGEIARINQNKNNTNRLKEMDDIWYILQKLNKYFKEDLFNYLQKQLRADKFDEMFNIRLYCLLSALRQNESLINIISTNVRKLNFKEKSKILKKLSNPLSKNEIKLSYQFGFQILKSFFVNNSKLGDLCCLLYCENQKNNLIGCQLVYNLKPGYFLFYKIDSMGSQLQTHERITRNQSYYSGIKQSNSDYVLVQIEDLISIIVFQPVWPSDPLFNQSILNVFFTDSDGRLSLCKEQKFQNLMSQIQNEQDEFNKQDMLDSLFGNGLVNSYSELSLTQFTPIFPDQINFDFQAIHQMKKQQSMLQGQNVFIRIYGDKFKLDPIDLASVSMACHFESHQKYQEILKSFSKFAQSNEEVSNIYLNFDDEMNNNAIYFADCILITSTIFESFMQGYDLFKNSYSYPKLNNSLQFLFGIQSIQEIKVKFISSIFEKIEFNFQRNFGQNIELIEYSDKTLKCYTLVNDNESVQLPDSGQIAHFLYDLILKYEKYQLQDCICEKYQTIKIGNDIQIENVKTIVDVLLLSKYFYKVIALISKESALNLQILNQHEIKATFKHTLYQFAEDGTLILNYEVFQDFSLADFFLDYLNNKQHHIKERYNDRILYIGPQIIFDRLDLNSNKLLNLQEEAEVQIVVYDSQNGLIENCKTIQSNDFQTIFLIFKINGVHQVIQTVISQQHRMLDRYLRQKSYEQTISNPLCLLIDKLTSNKSLDTQLNKIEWQEQKNKKTTFGNYMKKEKGQEAMKVKLILLTNQLLIVEFFSDKAGKLSLTSQSKNLSIIPNEFNEQITIEYKTLNQQDLNKTTHISIQSDYKTKQVQNEQDEQVSVGHGDPKLIKIIMKKAKQKTDEILLHKQQEPLQHSKELQLSNSINMLSKQEIAAATRAGNERIDEIEFRDNLDNRITNFTYNTIILVHSLFYQIQYFPKTVKENDRLKLIWTPTFKGVYKLFIDDVRIKGRFVILANSPSLQECDIEMPQHLNTIPFYEIVPFTFQLKDSFNNIYGDIESETFMDCKCEIVKTEGDSKIEVNFQNLAKGGSMNATINFIPQNAEGQEEDTCLSFMINKEVKIVKPIKISGVSLEKRRKRFDQELGKSFKPTSYNLNIRRMNFLKDLLELSDKKMNYTFSIKFQDEPGIDAGGLKREFYDMIGNTLKDETYKFFQPVQGNLSKYFLHKNFNKLKNKDQYALLFGKLIANAIANTYLIGIDIIAPFWKVVYNEKIVFEDLKIIWDKQTYENYENLSMMTAEMIDSLYLDFTYQVGNTTIELINNGSKIAVTKENVHNYLDKTAEYIIHKQFADIYKSFIQGFTSVVDMKIFQKWLRPAEISLLTQGLLEIKPETILSKLAYSGGKANHKSYFENYVNQADSQTLKNMLKFITGSSAIPYDQSSYIISVEFKHNLDIRKLPLAHTCFKSIEVPLYNNYGQMKQKLDIAFTIGLEGYGFG